MIRAVATERPAVVRIHLSLTIVEWSGALGKHTLVLTLTTYVDRRKLRKRKCRPLSMVTGRREGKDHWPGPALFADQAGAHTVAESDIGVQTVRRKQDAARQKQARTKVGEAEEEDMRPPLKAVEKHQSMKRGARSSYFENGCEFHEDPQQWVSQSFYDGSPLPGAQSHSRWSFRCRCCCCCLLQTWCHASSCEHRGEFELGSPDQQLSC
ncbi:hypothetical protein HG530_011134 [Fusarium avenaceum]|nr:hypothetical protein HG530_011134 [Fusarium avenaceum]